MTVLDVSITYLSNVRYVSFTFRFVPFQYFVLVIFVYYMIYFELYSKITALPQFIVKSVSTNLLSDMHTKTPHLMENGANQLGSRFQRKQLWL